MRTLIVTPSYLPIIGGSETLVRNLAKELNKSGIRTDVMTFNMTEKWKPAWNSTIERDGESTIYRIGALNPFVLLSMEPFYHPLRINVLPRPGFKQIISNYDIIHFLGEADLSLIISCRAVKKPKIMHCVGVPGLEEQFRRHTILKKFFVKVFPNLAHLYIVFSPDERQVLIEMGVAPSKVLVLPYGIDTEFFRPDEGKRRENLILFVGRIETVKGVHILLRSLKYLKAKTEVVLIGPSSDPRYLREIDKMCLQVQNDGVHRVKYLGSLDQHDLRAWYQSATVLVRPDIVGASGAGCSTMEALACGTPVVGVIDHVVEDEMNGLIVPPNNPKELGSALLRIMQDEELRARYGDEGRRMIEQCYSLKSASTKLVNVYKSLLGHERTIGL